MMGSPVAAARRGLVMLVLALSLLAAAATAHAAPWSDRGPDRAELGELLRSGDFATLEMRLEQYYDAYAAGDAPEAVVESAFAAFANTDRDFERAIRAWIKRHPRSYAARMAHAVYWQQVGWVAGGGDLNSLTPHQRMADMFLYFRSATDALDAVLRLKPGFGLAYAHKINILTVTGKHDWTEAVLRRGLRRDPKSVAIRRHYLISLQPWWHSNAGAEEISAWDRLGRWWDGDRSRAGLAKVGVKWWHAITTDRPLTDAIDDFLEEVAEDAEATPRLRPLLGFADFVRAEILRREGRLDAALEHYALALEFGDYWWYWQQQGLALAEAGRPADALASYDRALELRPQSPILLSRRAAAHSGLGDEARAAADWQAALAFDPKNPGILRARAEFLVARGEYGEALDALNWALQWGKLDDRAWAARGSLLMRHLGDPKRAAFDFSRALFTKPDNDAYMAAYLAALYQAEGCDRTATEAAHDKMCKRLRCPPVWHKMVAQGLRRLPATPSCGS